MLSIGTFSKISNTTTKTLRYYDEIRLLMPAYISPENGYRYYETSQLETILFINKLKSYSFSLEQIAEIIKNSNNMAFIIELFEKQHAKLEDGLKKQIFLLKEMEKDKENLERGIHLMSYLENIEITLKETKPMNILAIRTKMNVEEFGKYIGKLCEQIAREKLTTMGPPLTMYHSSEYTPEDYDMEIAVPIKERIKGTKDFPAYLCVHSVHKGSYSGLPSVYAKMQQWIEEKGYSVVAAPFEIYLTNPADTKPEDFVTEVYFPVKI